MAVILKTSYLQNVATPAEPLIYVDTINNDGFIAEMYNICIRHIEENTISPGITEFKRENFTAKDENDIYYNKKDGLWIISDEQTRIITLCKRTTSLGVIYNSIIIEKI